MPNKDRVRQLEVQRNHYQSNKETTIEKVRARKHGQRTKLYKIKSETPCADCGQNYPGYVMDFDHVRGDKVQHVSHMVGMSWENILLEVEKCDVVCSNCHRERTYQRYIENGELILAKLI